MNAVVTLLAQRTAAWSSSIPPLDTAPRATAARAARNPTTVAWTYNTRATSITEPDLKPTSGVERVGLASWVK